MKNTRQRLIAYFRAAYPGLALETHEEQRALGDIIAAAEEVDRGVAVWSATDGLQVVKPNARSIDDTNDLLGALPAIRRQKLKNTVIVLRDAHIWPFDRDPILPRLLRDALMWAPTEGSSIVLLGARAGLHHTVEKLVTVMDYELPSPEDLKEIAGEISKSGNGAGEVTEDVIRALSGLSTSEAENALALSLVESKAFTPEVIYREKVSAVRRSGLLEIVDADPRGLDAIGGLDALKGWIKKRARAYSKEARDYGLPLPKGVLLVGVPGTGKSLAARAIGTALNVPSVRLDVGSLFNSLVGESESRTREALKLAEAISPCVVWVDEIDKGLSGSSGSGSGDSGVTRRVFGTIISWMQERKRPVFLVATANGVSDLPPELLRKGRWDEIFAIDLPSLRERIAILEIHLKARSRKPEAFKLAQVGDATEGFTGAELEAVVVEAMVNAFDDDAREIETSDLVAAAQNTVPLSRTAKEQIDGIRAWASSRARWASMTVEEAPTRPTQRRRLA